MSKTYHCSQITKGKVDSAPALVSKDAICFYLVEPETGVVKERNHDAFGKSVVGKVLIMPSGKGSSVVQLDGLYKLMMRNNGPAAIVVQEADTVLVAAAAAMEMPMVHRVDPEFFTDVESGMNIALDVEQGTITIL
ncbi:aconitase X swivel domain-containing protein [Lawsonibacter sp. LCP25S3_F5]